MGEVASLSASSYARCCYLGAINQFSDDGMKQARKRRCWEDVSAWLSSEQTEQTEQMQHDKASGRGKAGQGRAGKGREVQGNSFFE